VIGVKTAAESIFSRTCASLDHAADPGLIERRGVKSKVIDLADRTTEDIAAALHCVPPDIFVEVFSFRKYVVYKHSRRAMLPALTQPMPTCEVGCAAIPASGSRRLFPAGSPCMRSSTISLIT
jgi:hypothetical protein